MLKEIIRYYSDAEPTSEEINALKERSVSENKVFFVEYYCENKDKILTLEFNNGEMNINHSETYCLKHNTQPDISEEELKRLCKALRDMTGEGFVSCKAALLNNNYNLQAAKDWLRQKGLA